MKNNRKYISSYESGFTLIEIIIVIVILGILYATFGGKVFSSSERIRVDLTKTKMESVKAAVGEFNLRYNKNPRSFQDLVSCTDLTGSGCVPLLSKDDILDAWGTEMRFESRGGRSYAITSYGANGEAGGEGVEADIVVEGP